MKIKREQATSKTEGKGSRIERQNGRRKEKKGGSERKVKENVPFRSKSGPFF